MLEYAHMLVHALNDITPLGLVAMALIVVYQLVSRRGIAHRLANNHLSDLPTMATSLKAIETHLESIPEINNKLGAIHNDISYLRGQTQAGTPLAPPKRRKR